MTSQRPEASDDKRIPIDAIDAGIELVESKRGPDALDHFEKEDYEDERTKLELRLLKSRIKNVKADRKLRKTYAGRILHFLEAYALAALALLICQGWRIGGFDLGSEVILAIVGSTAVAAIGLVGFVAKGLFPPNHS
ncbi:MAG: hypothetical protein ACPW61_09000 [Methyloligella sp. ZOD6]